MKGHFFILLFVSLFFSECHREKNELVQARDFDFSLVYTGPDTLELDKEDSVYKFFFLPVITNLTKDTTYFIGSIYGRMNHVNYFNVSPKIGVRLYQGGKEIEFEEYRGCGNWGYLNSSDFIKIAPGKCMFPFHVYKPDRDNFTFQMYPRIREKGPVEIEAYYNTMDTAQQSYHPFANNEMKMNLAISEYNEMRPLFKKLAHVDLKSNRIKVYLK